MDTAVTDTANGSLDELRQTLRSDGYDLDVEARGNVLHVAVRADAGTCGDCLVPKEIMLSLIRAALPDGLPITDVELTYPTG